MIGWLGAFVFTQAVEMPIYIGRLEGRRWPARAALAFVPTLVTHPVVWYGFPWLIPGDYYAMVVAAETFAIGVEAVLLRAFGVDRPLLVALVANCLSAGLGFASRAAFGWP